MQGISVIRLILAVVILAIMLSGTGTVLYVPHFMYLQTKGDQLVHDTSFRDNSSVWVTEKMSVIRGTWEADTGLKNSMDWNGEIGD
jgi:hypothetical protein